MATNQKVGGSNPFRRTIAILSEPFVFAVIKNFAAVNSVAKFFYYHSNFNFPSPASLSLLSPTKPMGFCRSPAALAGANPHLLYRLSPTPLQSSAPYSKASQQLILPRSPVIDYRFYQVIAISVFSGLSAVPIIGVAVSSAESAFISSAVRAKSKISIFSFILSVCTDFGITETPF